MQERCSYSYHQTESRPFHEKLYILRQNYYIKSSYLEPIATRKIPTHICSRDRSQSLSLQERCSAYYKCVRTIILMPNMHSSQIHRETEISYIHLWCKNSESGALSSASTSQLEKHHSSALYQRSYPKVSCSKAIGPSIQATEPRCPTSKFRVSRKTSLMKKRAWKQKTWKVCFLVNRFSENTASECPSTLIGHFENGTQAVTTWNVKRPKQSKSSFNKHIDKHWKIC